jgi:hypothetical protein
MDVSCLSSNVRKSGMIGALDHTIAVFPYAGTERNRDFCEREN